MPVQDRLFDPVQIAQVGEAMAGLEGAAATAAGGVLLWGWIFDPDDEIRDFSCELGGAVLLVELLDRTPRPDVGELLGATARSRPLEPGFLALAQTDPARLREAGGRITLRMRTSRGEAVSANRLLYEPGSRFAEVVGRRLPARVMRPDAVARAQKALWVPEARRTFAEARRNVEVQRLGPSGTPALSLVVPVADNAAVLRQSLVYLDMDPEAHALEVVVALAEESAWSWAERAVFEAATSLRVRLVRSGGPLTIGGAARIGLEAASAPVALLMPDTVVPPTGGWISRTREDLANAVFAAPAAMPRFDGLAARYEPRAAKQTAWPHDEARARVQAALAITGAGAWSPGLLAGPRDRLLALDAGWAEAADPDAFWVELLSLALREGATPLTAGDLFTVAPMAAHEIAPDAALLELYGLQARLERRLATASEGEPAR